MIIDSNQYNQGKSYQLSGVCNICWCPQHEEGWYYIETVANEYVYMDRVVFITKSGNIQTINVYDIEPTFVFHHLISIH